MPCACIRPLTGLHLACDLAGYVQAVNSSLYEQSSQTARAHMLVSADETPVTADRKDFHVVANASDVVHLVLLELEHRAGSWRR